MIFNGYSQPNFPANQPKLWLIMEAKDGYIFHKLAIKIGFHFYEYLRAPGPRIAKWFFPTETVEWNPVWLFKNRLKNTQKGIV